MAASKSFLTLSSQKLKYYFLIGTLLVAITSCTNKPIYSEEEVILEDASPEDIQEIDSEIVDVENIIDAEIEFEVDTPEDEDTGLCGPDLLPNACGGCGGSQGEFGSRCGTCNSGFLSCFQQQAVCAGDRGEAALDACGGCSGQNVELDEPCGRCNSGSWSCEGESLICQGEIDEEELNECGGCLQLPPETFLLDACGTCDTGNWRCRAEDYFCVSDQGESALNVCGGCGEVVIGIEGERCGVCDTGTWQCSNGELLCDGDEGDSAINPCGGCTLIEESVGERCGNCGDEAVWTCSEDNQSVFCEGNIGNACGGCTTLSEEFDSPCGTCGSGRFACGGPDALSCEGDLFEEALNSCGSCDELRFEPGTPCGSCGLDEWACVDGGVQCNGQTLCPFGETCSRDEHCLEGHCSNRVCVPLGLSFIPAGTFTMGAPDYEPGWRGEIQHQVTLTRSFMMQQTEVVQSEWERLMGANWSDNQDCGPNCPVESINYYEAVEYANRLSVDEGLQPCYFIGICNGLFGHSWGCDIVVWNNYDCNGYRLPTEAEWEYAARAGTFTAVYTGDVESRNRCEVEALDSIAWYCGNSDDQIHPVGQLEPNFWGLYDMIGNVFEWTWGWARTYTRESVTDPLGPEEGRGVVIRGCAFVNESIFCRAGNRIQGERWHRTLGVGLRLVRTFYR